MVAQRSTKEASKVIRIGKSEMDNKMGGGIPAGSLVLVEGQSDSGKSVLVQHYIGGALKGGSKVVCYTNENTVKSLVRQMTSLGMDVTDEFLLGYLSVFPVMALERGDSAEDHFNRLVSHIDSLDKEFDVIILDSITNLVTHSKEDEVIDFFSTCKRLCDQGRTIFLVVHSHAFSESMLIRVRSLCDGHFSLKVTYVGDRMVKMLEVAKIRGAERTTGNIVSFDVEPELGIKIIPIVMAKA